jgi:hypothetical protein
MYSTVLVDYRYGTDMIGYLKSYSARGQFVVQNYVDRKDVTASLQFCSLIFEFCTCFYQVPKTLCRNA